MPALVAGPASAFHLNSHTRSDAQAAPTREQAKLWYSGARGDVTLCLSAGCDATQQKSGYTILSENEGTVESGSADDFTPLYFSWSAANKDNWVTNNRTCPGPSYQNCGNADGVVCKFTISS